MGTVDTQLSSIFVRERLLEVLTKIIHSMRKFFLRCLPIDNVRISDCSVSESFQFSKSEIIANLPLNGTEIERFVSQNVRIFFRKF